MALAHEQGSDGVRWAMSPAAWLAVVAMVALLGAAFHRAIEDMVAHWIHAPQYSHGFFIPIISLFLIWRQRAILICSASRRAWSALFVVAGGLLLLLGGQLSTIAVVTEYGLLVALVGAMAAFFGWPAVRRIWAPLLFLVFMIPLPGFLYNNLSQQLQLLSSQIGVWVIRGFGIPVYLEGNVIDLGAFKLQVVEACSGLKYLFSLTSIAFLCAYIFHAPLWKRIIVFLSAIPITIFMNSFRIGVTGVMVEYGGIRMAEGFFHEFEGLVVFGAALGILFAEMALLSRLGRHGTTLRDAFVLQSPPLSGGGDIRRRTVPMAFMYSLVLVALTFVMTQFIGSRHEIIPQRASFAEFPDRIGSWTGSRDRLEPIYLDKLKLDDYLLANYSSPAQGTVNFYVAYYASQATGESAHSPRACIPGGGWVIKSLSKRRVPGVTFFGKPLLVNRVLIEMGDVKQVVYYWFPQRGRDLTNDYLVKWYLFWDALTRNRTDGALVRLTTLVKPGEDVRVADERLTRFAKDVSIELQKYIPD